MKGFFRLAVFFGVFFCVQNAHAATLYIDPHETEMYPGDTIALSVRIDTDDGECINAVDSVLQFSNNITPVDVSLGESIFPLWIQAPQINKAENTVSFAGGIPNGYCGRIEGDPRLTNVILELIVQAPGMQVGADAWDPNALIYFEDTTQVLLNGNEGARAPLNTIDANIYIHDEPSDATVNEWGDRVDVDDIPPSKFSVTVTSEPTIFGGRYFIVFNTTDKQSGIDHYEVIEEPIDEISFFRWGAVDAPWKEVRSPYVLEDQTLNSTIRVKAVDKAGNEYIAVYVPPESMRGNRALPVMELGVFGGVVGVLLIIGLAVWFYMRRTRTYTLEHIESYPQSGEDVDPEDTPTIEQQQ